MLSPEDHDAHDHSGVPGVGGTSVIQYADAQLTDTQIKALPTGGLQIVPAPGAGQMLMFVRAVILADTTNGAYTNIDAAATLQFRVSGKTLSFAGEDNGEISELLAAEDVYVQVYGHRSTGGTEGSPIAGGEGAFGNQPLMLYLPNGVSGNLTGGNAANTLSIRVWYDTVPTEPFGA